MFLGVMVVSGTVDTTFYLTAVEEVARYAIRLTKAWVNNSRSQGSDVTYLAPAHGHGDLHVLLVHGSLKQLHQNVQLPGRHVRKHPHRRLDFSIRHLLDCDNLVNTSQGSVSTMIYIGFFPYHLPVL